MPISANELVAALPRLRRYARILTDDAVRADRMVEETLARVREHVGVRAAAPSTAAHLWAVLRAVHAERCASLPGETAAPVAAGDPDEPAGADPTAAPGPSEARAQEVRAQLFELPLEQREIVVLVAVERMSYDEISVLLGIPVAAVISRLAQARERLRTDRASYPLSTPKNGN